MLVTTIVLTVILALTVGSYQLFNTALRVADWRYTTKLGEIGNLLTFILLIIFSMTLGILVGIIIGGYF